MRRVPLILILLVGAFALLPAHAVAQGCPECEEYELVIPDATGGKNTGGGGGGKDDSGGGSSAPADDTSDSGAVSGAPGGEPAPAPAPPAPADQAAKPDTASDGKGRPRRSRGKPERSADAGQLKALDAMDLEPIASQPLAYEGGGAANALTDELSRGGVMLMVAVLAAIAGGGLWLRRRRRGGAEG